MTANSLTSPEEMIERFSLTPHPFDGWFAQVVTERDTPKRFHYFLKAGEFASWHKTKGQLLLTHIDGAPLTVSVCCEDETTCNTLLGRGQTTAMMIEPHRWRTWVSMGAWTLMMVSTQKREDFCLWDLAPDDWHPAVS